MKRIQRLSAILLSLGILTAWLITSFEIAMYSDFDVYRREYEKYEVLPELNMSMEDAMDVTKEMMAYLRGKGETLSVVTVVDGREQDFFNEQDRFHMGEVRALFLGGLALRRIALAIIGLSALILFLTKAEWKSLVVRCWQGTFVCVGLFFALIGILAAVNFNQMFVLFHEIFFDNDLWIFDPATDYMIRMLPEGLFADMVLRIGVLFAGGMSFLFVLSFLWKKGKKEKESKIL